MVKRIEPDIHAFKTKALHWANTFDTACYLDSNGYTDLYGKYQVLIAAGAQQQTSSGSFQALKDFLQDQSDRWCFGFFAYDLKNEIEDLGSANEDHLGFPDLYFFAPEHLLIINGSEVHILSAKAEEVYQKIMDIGLPAVNRVNLITPVCSRFSREEYVRSVRQIKDHITRGDIYVTNFCQEFYTENSVVNPLQTFRTLNNISPNPQAAYFKMGDRYIISATPERFLAKRGSKLISQPIKGTAARGLNAIDDDRAKTQLRELPKEQQENVMIVDLVRNDLARAAKPGTVQVESLFDVQSFKQVHQMISTVTCEIGNGISPVDAIRSAFPMGSMTGAPKLRAMQLMEQFERSKRGVYSGAIGYFSPDGDFDFNVVIRTLLYNAEKRYLSFHVGSAITFDADPEKEYDECLLKAKAILEVLDQKVSS